MALNLDPGPSGASGAPGVTDPSDGAIDPAPRSPRRAALGSRRRQIVAAVVILGALGFLAFEGLSNATVYFKTANQAVQDRQSLGTRDFRIEGTVGQSITQVGQTFHFTITSNGVTVPVVDTGSPSQLFKRGIPVVLEGHWQGDTYLSDQIMVKHSSSYTEAHPNRLKPQPTPGDPTPGAGQAAPSSSPGSPAK